MKPNRSATRETRDEESECDAGEKQTEASVDDVLNRREGASDPSVVFRARRFGFVHTASLAKIKSSLAMTLGARANLASNGTE
jgi:hypothetical protein